MRLTDAGTRFEVGHVMYRLMLALAFGSSIAAVVILVGNRDLEEYEHAIFSLDRGTAVEAVRVLDHPVYTLAVGLGARLPLHGSLGASPVTALAPFVPMPVTYGLLLAFSIAAAALVVQHALEPPCGRVVSWLSMVLLFCSVPMVNYTISDDWLEAAVTHGAIVSCVFAPHALLSLLTSSSSPVARCLAAVSVASLIGGLSAVAHPGYWPLLVAALALASMLALCRSEYPMATRVATAGTLAVAMILAIAPQVPDISRDLDAANAAGPMRRISEGPGGSFLAANVFPLAEPGARMPFTYLGLAVVSILIGMTSPEAHAKRVIVGSALISIALGVAAATLSIGFTYAPSNTGGLRDPAAAFAVLGAATAAGVVRRAGGVNRLVRRGLVIAALVFAGLQGPAYAATLVISEVQRSGRSVRWNQDTTAPQDRAAIRGLTPDRVPPGGRLALWPEVRGRMRNTKKASTDFADAGYLLVTAWTKQRTMRGLVEPNDLLFNQSTDLSARILCDPEAVRFLQLRYLLRPSDVAACAPWSWAPGLLVDGWLEVDVARDRDDRLRALPAARLTEPRSRQPALSPGSALLPALAPLPGTSLMIESPRVVVRLDDPSVAKGQALVLPVAYDAAWRTSSGRTHNVGGLLAIVGVDQRQVTLEFVPDLVAVLRALSMTLAQVLTVAGVLGLTNLQPTVR